MFLKAFSISYYISSNYRMATLLRETRGNCEILTQHSPSPGTVLNLRLRDEEEMLTTQPLLSALQSSFSISMVKSRMLNSTLELLTETVVSGQIVMISEKDKLKTEVFRNSYVYRR